jgi:putative nucleotidyltransferase with HDIG domain
MMLSQSEHLLKKRQEAGQPAFIPIHIESLRIDKILGFDIYIYVGRELVLYRSQTLAFTVDNLDRLRDNNVQQIYITHESKAAYQRYIEDNLSDILTDPHIEEVKKAEILYDTSKALVKDVLANPSFPENIKRSQDLVENTIDYILKGREAFLSLMRITSFNYYTYTHSVNVTTFSLALARQLGIEKREELAILGTGALLHDVGKSKVPERILTKRTSLNRSEFEIMKKHPGWGGEILRETDLIHEESYFPVLHHHERLDGSGYPFGLLETDMHPHSRIVAIADVFDALTTERVYQSAIETFSALKLMHGMKNNFDQRLLREFTVMMGPDSAHVRR